MNKLQDILTYMRRIIKTPSNAVITDNLLIDYVNRFLLMDVDARMQLFDYKTKYSFQTTPGVDKYNMPLYSVQNQPDGSTPPGALNQIAMFPVYQGFLGPAYINGVAVEFQTQQDRFYSYFPDIVQNLQVVGVGDGTTGPYTLNIPLLPSFTNPPNPPLQGLLRGHVDITGIISTGVNQDPPLVTSAEITANDPFIQNIPVTSVDSKIYITTIDSTGATVVVQDSGQFLSSNVNYGLLMTQGKAPNGNLPLSDTPVNYSTTANTINYFTGVATVNFPVSIPVGNNINVQCYYFQTGLPRSILFFNNTLTLRSPPDKSYLVEIDAYLTPAAFLSTEAAVPFGYMAEYIARGAARKILADTGDWEQFDRYEPLFLEQERLVWKRSQRQFTSTRTETIYSQRGNITGTGFNNYSGGF